MTADLIHLATSRERPAVRACGTCRHAGIDFRTGKDACLYGGRARVLAYCAREPKFCGPLATKWERDPAMGQIIGMEAGR